MSPVYSQDHTPGPWQVGKNGTTAKGHAICSGPMVIGEVYGRGYPIGKGWAPDSAADAARITACVNACDGMRDPAQEISWLRSSSNNVPAMCAEVEALRTEIARLKGALQAVMREPQGKTDCAADNRRVSVAMFNIARTALTQEAAQ